MDEAKISHVPITVKIKKVATGEVRSYADELYRTDDYDGIFIWEEGNYSCDCNRGNFFARVNNEEDPNEPCWNESGLNKYTVEIEENGAIIYSEWKE